MARSNGSTVVLSVFSGAVSLLSGIFILTTNWDPSFMAGMAVGILTVLIGVFFVAALGFKSLLVILFGFYTMGRAVGVVDSQYLRYGLGVPLVILGLLVIVRSLKPSKQNAETDGQKQIY